MRQPLQTSSGTMADRPRDCDPCAARRLELLEQSERDAVSDAAPMAEAAACLDPAVPLEELALRAAQQTRDHFAVAGAPRHRMLLYAPLYLSSHCINHCIYCGFRHPNDIPRKHLDLEEALGQAEILGSRGLRHILLVAGDFPRLTTTGYYAEIIA